MKIKFLLTGFLSVILLAISPDASAAKQTDIKAFWKDFKSAVTKGDKNAVAAMTKFPLNMPFGLKPVSNKAGFIRRYDEIFNGEADAAKCFPKAELEKESAKRYAVYCGFKETPEDEENKPIRFYFEMTKTGWKFAGLDNINE